MLLTFQAYLPKYLYSARRRLRGLGPLSECPTLKKSWGRILGQPVGAIFGIKEPLPRAPYIRYPELLKIKKNCSLRKGKNMHIEQRKQKARAVAFKWWFKMTKTL
ncbi:hypothetical protein TNCT_432581 [Trichonephila clavata]|uniref:Uncharacterized protein n=1 Tax=Trichonephila clavata TaxID=2740835 RepID=A0A8X6F166_TRICU|nr:hypothetical protein TNCT_432581 [Trichonephila clavata]